MRSSDHDTGGKAADPRARFESPEAVRDSPDLGREQKIRILRDWAYDIAESNVALEEGMPESGRDDIERRILTILEQLGGDLDLEHTGPSKQHGIPSGARQK